MSEDVKLCYTREEIATHEAAVLRAVRAATLEHARLGRPVVGMRDGEIVWVSPEEVIARAEAEGWGNHSRP